MKVFNKEKIKEKVIEKLKTILDLELPISIYDLGLIYKIEVQKIDDKVNVNIENTVINSTCNSTKSFTDKIIDTVKSVDEVDTCKVKFVFSPKWEVTMITQEGLEILRKANSK
ncbi:metal-sulfur cluster assembly factor [Poseidonibacter lekithochrous]|uniref:metal-sulfur cluster assembly factor n=1 Tax=Poseidonibacter TaxID=2321187 RepID=UPI001C09F7C7|nr:MULTISPECIES: metal-sulfur cluster assembly factor [Poseidonibacter]MBU3015071.1 metal-sulfur cluster assembly factor [Poseidonibacter lekithochrous]MDO6828367.1 metal-sulfur cluster assembly factor [Poseidonibacter sp. 1_MG-2023]